MERGRGWEQIKFKRLEVGKGYLIPRFSISSERNKIILKYLLYCYMGASWFIDLNICLDIHSLLALRGEDVGRVLERRREWRRGENWE
jgi:hypothetical protein